jgi:hypothetical protein
MTQYESVPTGFSPSNDGDFDDRELNWDSEIEKEGAEYVTLADGDYDFEVLDFERGRHEGSAKLPPCPKAILHIKVEGKDKSTGAEGATVIRHQLFLHSKTEGLLSNFFTSIGLKKKGEKLKMNWSLVPGSKGRVKIGTRIYEGKEYNEIKRFYEPIKANATPLQQTPVQTSFEVGKF